MGGLKMMRDDVEVSVDWRSVATRLASRLMARIIEVQDAVAEGDDIAVLRDYLRMSSMAPDED
jgi:hypothetical protein